MRANGLIGLCLAAAAGFAAAGCAEILGLEPSDAGPGNGGSGAGAPGGSGGSGAGNTGGSGAGSNTGGSGASTGSNTGGSGASTGSSTGGSDPATNFLTFGGSGVDTALAVAAGANGNAVVGGQFVDQASFGPDIKLISGMEPDAFVFHADAALSVLAAARIGSITANDGTQVVTAAALGGGQLAVAGFFTGEVNIGGTIFNSVPATAADAFVALFNPDGSLDWAVRFGGIEDDLASGIAFLPDGNLAVTANIQGAVDVDSNPVTSYGGYDSILVKFNIGAGKAEWVEHFGSMDQDFVWGLAVDSSSSQIAVVGTFSGTMSFSDFSTLSSVAGSNDAYAAQFDSTGKPQWQTGLGDAAQQSGLAVAIDSGEPGVIVAGSFTGQVASLAPLGDAMTPDVFIVKLSQDKGDSLWAHGFTDTGLHQARQLGLAARDKQIVVTGGFVSGANFGAGSVTASNIDAFIVRLDAVGDYQSSQFVTGGIEERAHAAAIGPSGEIYAIGEFTGAAVFDNKSFQSAGATDGFLMRIPGP